MNESDESEEFRIIESRYHDNRESRHYDIIESRYHGIREIKNYKLGNKKILELGIKGESERRKENQRKFRGFFGWLYANMYIHTDT